MFEVNQILNEVHHDIYVIFGKDIWEAGDAIIEHRKQQFVLLLLHVSVDWLGNFIRNELYLII